jgi:hypothetical protein
LLKFKSQIKLKDQIDALKYLIGRDVATSAKDYDLISKFGSYMKSLNERYKFNQLELMRGVEPSKEPANELIININQTQTSLLNTEECYLPVFKSVEKLTKDSKDSKDSKNGNKDVKKSSRINGMSIVRSFVIYSI